MIIAGLNCQITVTIETWPPSSIVPKPPQFSQLDIKVSSCILPKQGEEVKVKCLLVRGRKGGREVEAECVGVLEGLNEAVLGHHGNCSMRNGWKVCVTPGFIGTNTRVICQLCLFSLVRLENVGILSRVHVCVCVFVSLCPGTMSCSSSLTPVRAPPCTRGSTLQTSWLWPAVKLERTPCRWVAYPQTKEMN